MSLLLVIRGAGGNWAPEPWHRRFSERLTDRRVHLWPAMPADLSSVRYVAVWKPPAGLLTEFPKLEAIFNLGAGVDALMQDTSLPAVPLVRVVTDDLTKRMTEYVVFHVLLHHRQQRLIDEAQKRRAWDPPEQAAAGAVRVGLMGMGELGRDAAEVLLRIGFKVNGWSRSPKSVPGVRTFAGQAGLDAFLGETDILVALMPLTPETRGILDRRLFSKLARNGVLGRPVIINAGRGGLQVERDIIACLDDGTLSAASLDVFETEPLPDDSPLWTHPKVTVTPHNAADSDPDAISDYVVGQIRAYERGEPLRHVVDRAKGY